MGSPSHGERICFFFSVGRCGKGILERVNREDWKVVVRHEGLHLTKFHDFFVFFAISGTSVTSLASLTCLLPISRVEFVCDVIIKNTGDMIPIWGVGIGVPSGGWESEWEKTGLDKTIGESEENRSTVVVELRRSLQEFVAFDSHCSAHRVDGFL